MVSNCTFTGNRNAVDDMGGESVYANSLFMDNNLTDGLPGTERYELDLPAGEKYRDVSSKASCVIPARPCLHRRTC